MSCKQSKNRKIYLAMKICKLRTVKCTLRNAASNNFKRFARIQQQKTLHVLEIFNYAETVTCVVTENEEPVKKQVSKRNTQSGCNLESIKKLNSRGSLISKIETRPLRVKDRKLSLIHI